MGIKNELLKQMEEINKRLSETKRDFMFNCNILENEEFYMMDDLYYEIEILKQIIDKL